MKYGYTHTHLKGETYLLCYVADVRFYVSIYVRPDLRTSISITAITCPPSLSKTILFGLAACRHETLLTVLGF